MQPKKLVAKRSQLPASRSTAEHAARLAHPGATDCTQNWGHVRGEPLELELLLDEELELPELELLLEEDELDELLEDELLLDEDELVADTVAAVADEDELLEVADDADELDDAVLAALLEAAVVVDAVPPEDEACPLELVTDAEAELACPVLDPALDEEEDFLLSKKQPEVPSTTASTANRV